MFANVNEKWSKWLPYVFMLMAAFSGLDAMKAAYAHAIATDYRFYSYGDACLLFPAVGNTRSS